MDLFSSKNIYWTCRKSCMFLQVQQGKFTSASSAGQVHQGKFTSGRSPVIQMGKDFCSEQIHQVSVGEWESLWERGNKRLVLRIRSRADLVAHSHTYLPLAACKRPLTVVTGRRCWQAGQGLAMERHWSTFQDVRSWRRRPRAWPSAWPSPPVDSESQQISGSLWDLQQCLARHRFPERAWFLLNFHLPNLTQIFLMVRFNLDTFREGDSVKVVPT